MITTIPKTFFIFDVESIGLHGEGFAVAGGHFVNNGACLEGFTFSCPPEEAAGDADDREWVKLNVPILTVSHRVPRRIRDAFWEEWMKAKKSGAVMAVECGWPVEANFLARCIADDVKRKWEGPYPLHEIASFLVAAGMDPMAKYERQQSELPEHNPWGDVMLSARLLGAAITTITGKP